MIIIISERYPCSSCKEILDRDYLAPSGEYSIRTSRGKTLKNVSRLGLLLLSFNTTVVYVKQIASTITSYGSSAIMYFLRLHVIDDQYISAALAVTSRQRVFNNSNYGVLIMSYEY